MPAAFAAIPDRTILRMAEKKMSKSKLGGLVSTTEGRKHFPDFIQDAYGEKSIVGFDRYGRFLGTLVPPEAIQILAGDDDAEIDEYALRKIREYARELLDEIGDREANGVGKGRTTAELRAKRMRMRTDQ